jgi:hypothetical protein
MPHFLLYKNQYYNAANILRIIPSDCHKFAIIELSHETTSIMNLFMKCSNSETSDPKFASHQTIEELIGLLNQPKSTIIAIEEYDEKESVN